MPVLPALTVVEAGYRTAVDVTPPEAPAAAVDDVAAAREDADSSAREDEKASGTKKRGIEERGEREREKHATSLTRGSTS